ncbi:MAG TPA: ankyrin repeat domain-containing protein [Pyrinomonadaceae bacterium]|nr:ankyrin repeat domain-containing protein [Pyrinomonadaceae bacterium]
MSSTISLTNAVTSGDEGTVSALLANGADVNETTGGGQTALILAVIFGHTSLVKLLVNAGADPQLRDNLGLNAIEWAKRRGSREALEVLTDTPQSITAPVFEIEEPVPPVSPPTPAARESEVKETVSDDEKSRRWLAGLRQRLDEQEVRRSNRIEEIEPPVIELPKPPEPEKPLVVRPAVARIFEVPAEVPPTGGKRKRCPRCNAIYNGDLLSYCAHHIVPLVDYDEPIITDTPQKSSVPLFWILVLVTLSGSIVIGTIVSTYLYRSSQANAPTAVAAPTIQKGFPELDAGLAGKAVSLPEAECPLSGSEHLAGTVKVNVTIDRNGEVSKASGSGGDWLMRAAATDAAMKSTFSPEKIRGREIEGTITYTFKPQ